MMSRLPRSPGCAAGLDLPRRLRPCHVSSIAQPTRTHTNSSVSISRVLVVLVAVSFALFDGGTAASMHAEGPPAARVASGQKAMRGEYGPMAAAADADRPFAGTLWVGCRNGPSGSMFRRLSSYGCVGLVAENGRKVVPGIRSMVARCV